MHDEKHRPEQVKEDTTCDACGRELLVTYIDPLSQTEVKGIAPTMEMCLHLGPMSEEAVQKVYPELLLNHHYRVCMVCSLTSMGVKFEYSKSSDTNRLQQDQTGRVAKN